MNPWRPWTHELPKQGAHGGWAISTKMWGTPRPPPFSLNFSELIQSGTWISWLPEPWKLRLRLWWALKTQNQLSQNSIFTTGNLSLSTLLIGPVQYPFEKFFLPENACVVACPTGLILLPSIPRPAVQLSLLVLIICNGKPATSSLSQGHFTSTGKNRVKKSGHCCRFRSPSVWNIGFWHPGTNLGNLLLHNLSMVNAHGSILKP